MSSSWSRANPPLLRMQMQPPGPAATAERLALPACTGRLLSNPVFWFQRSRRHGRRRGLEHHPFSLSPVYQRNAVHMDKTAAEWNWGLRGPGLSTLLGGLARFLCVFLLLWPPAPSSRSHHTQRRSSDGAVAAALVSGQYLETSLSCIIHAEQSGFNI